MKTSAAPINTAFSGSIPSNYDEYLGPLFFEPFSQHLGAHIAQLAPTAVLELACGTGRLTRQMDAHLPGTSTIVATDVNPAMLQVAQEQLGGRGIEWNVVDAVSLPYPDARFDLVVAQFGVMFYSDRAKAYREALRVLKPGGRLLFTCWDEVEKNPAAHITQQVIKEFFPTDTPAFYTVPFSYHDKELIREEVLLAGFDHIHCEQVTLEGYAGSEAMAARGLLEGSPIHTSILDRDPFALPVMLTELGNRLARRFGAKDLRVPLNAWVVEAIKH